MDDGVQLLGNFFKSCSDYYLIGTQPNSLLNFDFEFEFEY